MSPIGPYKPLSAGSGPAAVREANGGASWALLNGLRNFVRMLARTLRKQKDASDNEGS
jgi:hypothetical protein